MIYFCVSIQEFQYGSFTGRCIRHDGLIYHVCEARLSLIFFLFLQTILLLFQIALQIVRQRGHIEPVVGGAQVQLDEDKAESGSVSNESVVEGVEAEAVDRKKSENAAEAEIVDSPADQVPTLINLVLQRYLN